MLTSLNGAAQPQVSRRPHGRSQSTSGGGNSTASSSSSIPTSFEEAPASVNYVKIDSSKQLEEEYSLGETLGEGAFGRVLLAVRRRDGEKFAVKKLAKIRDTKSTYGKSWENEIRVLRRFQHVNIVRLEVVYESEHNCYLFMELCDAGTLSDELERRGRFSEHEARDLLRQVGCGLRFLHKSRIVHRDLKLQNCLLRRRSASQMLPTQQQQHSISQRSRLRSRAFSSDDDNSTPDACPFAVKLTDFGLSIELRGMEQALVDNVGTPVYQAPEIVSGASYTYKCDVWALGVIAFTMLHGASPYDAAIESGGADLGDAIVNFNYSEACADCRLCRGLSRECRVCLQRLLLNYQADRWSAAEFMDSAWMRGALLPPDSGDGAGGGQNILELMRSMNKAKV